MGGGTLGQDGVFPALEEDSQADTDTITTVITIIMITAIMANTTTTTGAAMIMIIATAEAAHISIAAATQNEKHTDRTSAKINLTTKVPVGVDVLGVEAWGTACVSVLHQIGIVVCDVMIVEGVGTSARTALRVSASGVHHHHHHSRHDHLVHHHSPRMVSGPRRTLRGALIPGKHHVDALPTSWRRWDAQQHVPSTRVSVRRGDTLS